MVFRWEAVIMLSNEGDKLTRVAVCSPRKEYFDVGNMQQHNIVEVADRDTAMRQHKNLRSVLLAFGSEVVDSGEHHGGFTNRYLRTHESKQIQRKLRTRTWSMR